MDTGGKMRALSIALLVICLAGCYETEKPLLDKGEKTAFSGKFSCKNSISGKTSMLNITEQKEGFWPFATYRYVDGDGGTYLFKKLPTGMFLWQGKGKQGTYRYLYLDATDKNTLIFLIPDLMSKAPYIDVLVKKYKIETAKGFEAIRLKGDNSALLDFLGAHDKTHLSAVAACQRQ